MPKYLSREEILDAIEDDPKHQPKAAYRSTDVANKNIRANKHGFSESRAKPRNPKIEHRKQKLKEILTEERYLSDMYIWCIKQNAYYSPKKRTRATKKRKLRNFVYKKDQHAYDLTKLKDKKQNQEIILSDTDDTGANIAEPLYSVDEDRLSEEVKSLHNFKKKRIPVVTIEELCVEDVSKVMQDVTLPESKAKLKEARKRMESPSMIEEVPVTRPKAPRRRVEETPQQNEADVLKEQGIISNEPEQEPEIKPATLNKEKASIGKKSSQATSKKQTEAPKQPTPKKTTKKQIPVDNLDESEDIYASIHDNSNKKAESIKSTENNQKEPIEKTDDQIKTPPQTNDNEEPPKEKVAYSDEILNHIKYLSQIYNTDEEILIQLLDKYNGELKEVEHFLIDSI